MGRRGAKRMDEREDYEVEHRISAPVGSFWQ